MKNNYDIVVIGGGTAGCAAAYISGKLGLRTLLLEKKSHLGGTITSGLVIPVMHSGNNQINTDFYTDLISELKSIGGQINYQGNSGWFNPELLKIVLDKMMDTAGVEVIFNAKIADITTYTDSNLKKYIKSIQIPIKTCSNIQNKLLSVHNEAIHADNNYYIKNEILSPYIEASYFLDTTGNCDFSKKINCEFLENSDEFQPMSLRFIMSGVNIEKFADWIFDYDKDRTVTTVQKDDSGLHFSTAYTWDTNKQWALAPIFDKAVACGDLKDTDRNYFQIFTVAGTLSDVAFNCPRIPENLDPTSILDTSKALKEARGAIYRLSNFCKKYFPGFEDAYISNIADELGIRVSNRIKGKYVYTIEDLKSGKKFNNPVLISDYPVDIHTKDKNTSTLEKNGEYQLPIESLMSADYENLFVAGRCLSADYLAQGALRVQSSCFSMGEAVAKYIKSTIINN